MDIITGVIKKLHKQAYKTILTKDKEGDYIFNILKLILLSFIYSLSYNEIKSGSFSWKNDNNELDSIFGLFRILLYSTTLNESLNLKSALNKRDILVKKFLLIIYTTFLSFIDNI
jgi:hypothetical protein